jgi:hypothetical protein
MVSALGYPVDDPMYKLAQSELFSDPEWASRASARADQIHQAVREDMGLRAPQGFAQNAQESMGVMLGQLPIPGKAVEQGAEAALEAPSVLNRIAQGAEWFSPTVDPKVANYGIGALTGGVLGTLGDESPPPPVVIPSKKQKGLYDVRPAYSNGEIGYSGSDEDQAALLADSQGHADGGRVSALDKLVEEYLARHGGPYGGNSRKYVDAVRGKMVQVPEKPEELELLDDYSEAPWHWGTSEQDDLKKLVSRYAIDLDPEHGLYRGVAAAHPGGAVDMDYTPGRSVQTTTLPVTSVTSNRGEATDFARLFDDHPDNAVLHLNRKAPIRAMPLPQSGQSEWLLPRPDDWKVTSVQDNPNENVKNVMVDYTQMKKYSEGGSVKDYCEGGVATARAMRTKYADGGRVNNALKAIKDAIAHLDNNDVPSAIRTLHASPDALRDPNIATAVQRLKNPTSARVGRSALDAAVAADANRTVEATFAKGGLTSRARNALPDSTFAGPDRSYPVPDASHAANAKGRAKQQLDRGNLSSSSYSKIIAKANRVLGKTKE